MVVLPAFSQKLDYFDVQRMATENINGGYIASGQLVSSKPQRMELSTFKR